MSGLLKVLETLRSDRALVGRDLVVGVRECCTDWRVVPPSTVWERLVRLFRGPVYAHATGHIEVCVVAGVGVRVPEERVRQILQEVLPCGVSADVKVYTGIGSHWAH